MTIARYLTFAWLALTLIGLALPAESLPETSAFGTDKVMHFVLFYVGAVTALLGWPSRRGLVLLALLVFAPLTEVWQAVLPTGRQADVFDVVANVLGVLAGWGTVRLFRREAVPA